MNAIVVFAILLASAFSLAFFTKRRFGILGLALCAGSLLSTTWAATLTPLVERQGITLVSPPLSAVVACALILLPPILLLFSGPMYQKVIPRVLSAAGFALLAVTFMLEPISAGVVFDPASHQVFQNIKSASNVLIVAGIVAALVDILLTRTPKRKDH